MKRTPSSRRYSHALLILSSCLLMLLILSAHDITLAETVITNITGDGLGTQVLPPNNHVYGITGGKSVDTNLFHSFAQFNVAPGDTAQFQTPTLTPNMAMHNILGRITGTSSSTIFGIIDSATYYPNANLFLMNPYGFLFGPTAMVNVGGMVAFTSADYLRLADNVRFDAMPNAAADALLSTAPVVAYGFLGSNPGAITVQGSQFSVTDGQSISLVGGTITIESGTPEGGTAQTAQFSAPNGEILLASAASPGEFDATTLRAVDGVSFTSFGSVSLAPGSLVDVGGTGKVSIRGGAFTLEIKEAILSTEAIPSPPGGDTLDSLSLTRGSAIVTATAGEEAGADVQLVGRSISLDGASITSVTTGEGANGAITVTAEDSVSLTGGAQIVSRTEGSSVGGNITVEATSETGSIMISGYDPDGTLSGIMNPFAFDPNTESSPVSSGIYSLTSGTQTATGGTITISAPTVSLDNVALVWTAASGDGAGGNITVTNAESVSISEGAGLKSDAGQDYNTFELKGSGRGGDISVSASATLLVSGGNIDFGAFSTISSQTSNGALSSGRAGDITISAPNVTLENAGTISSLSLGTGRAGNIDVTASSQLVVSGFNPDFLVDSGLRTSVLFPQDSQSNGGGIHVTTPSLTLENRGLIQTSVSGAGIKGGDIFLDVTNLTLQNGGSIVSSAGSGATSSHIQITASGTATISGRYIDPNDPGLNLWSAIQNRTNSNQSENGGIDIHAGKLIMKDGPQYAPPDDIGEQILIRTDAEAGGTIRIIADESVSMSSGANIVNEKGSLELGGISLEAPSITLSQSAIRGRTNIDRDAAGISLHATNGDLSLSNDSHVLTSTQQGRGKGGFTLLRASGSINMSGASTVESSSVSPATGDGGAVTLTAGNQVSLSGTGTALKTTTSGLGDSGSILVKGQSVTLSDHASISTSSTGPGNAGNIQIDAGNQFAMTDSSVTTEANQAGGGAIKISTNPGGTVQLTNSKISASVLDGTGGGGSVNIDPQFVILQNSHILATATHGPGGNISITTNLLLPDAYSTISASSQFGVNGTVTIQSPNAPGSGQVQPLGKTPLQATSLLNQHCASLAGGEFSSFTVAGRESLPTEPGSWLTSPLATLNAGMGLGVKAEGVRPVVRDGEPEGETALLSLRQIAPAGFLTQAFAVDWSANCES